VELTKYENICCKITGRNVLVFQSFENLRKWGISSSGVAAIWTFWIYPGAADSEGAAKIGLIKQ